MCFIFTTGYCLFAIQTTVVLPVLYMYVVLDNLAQKIRCCSSYKLTNNMMALVLSLLLTGKLYLNYAF